MRIKTAFCAGWAAWAPKPAHVFVNHGDDASCTQFAACLQSEHGYSANAPYSGACYDLAAGRYVYVAGPVPRQAAQAPGRTGAAQAELEHTVQALLGLCAHGGRAPQQRAEAHGQTGRRPAGRVAERRALKGAPAPKAGTWAQSPLPYNPIKYKSKSPCLGALA